MLGIRQYAAHHLHAAVLFFLASGMVTAATVTVTPTVTSSGGLFHYGYSISNATPDDSFLIDIPVLANPLAITNLTAPAGFKSSFDSGLGLVSFLEDTKLFTSTAQSGFSFDSTTGPGSVNFQATLLSSTTGGLYTISGPTLAPVVTAVPEPGSFSFIALFGTVCLAFGLIRRRSRLTVQM